MPIANGRDIERTGRHSVYAPPSEATPSRVEARVRVQVTDGSCFFGVRGERTGYESGTGNRDDKQQGRQQKEQRFRAFVEQIR